ncbi:fumarylacetoacetate hydrolase family protein [Steroidobacter sp. S1-65]|uniref:Fumarylacetoacetate hydrolase family protein n=1 Tax=Steroidobacter gossypii TaxID=2805490 RepID=A0ABS1WQC7_9GAMM|nr:fumarylacetoacetate hydrolase family protein [Steroidobacter gossypii]MBM0103163.1 fumarylacetoacetate hydrolase family protein [Steroidobacter gossypii]
MKLASIRSSSRDGQLVVVSRDLTKAVAVPQIAPTMQAALDDWSNIAPELVQVAAALEQGAVSGSFAFDPSNAMAPLPRAYHWVDGSAYVNHVELVRKARGAQMPESFWTDPLVYQGGSDDFLGARQDVPVPSEEFGIDLEGEVAIVTDDVPMGTKRDAAFQHIKLIMLVNDWSLRNLIPGELAKGFGFYQSKPATAFSPVAVTPDELGDAWSEGRVHLPLVVHINGQPFGKPNAGVDMTFDFARLVEHITLTRNARAGTVLGSGTISNYDRSLGSACIAERRTLEQIEQGKPVTSFLKFGDSVRIEMFDGEGRSIFGAIEQKVVRA